MKTIAFIVVLLLLIIGISVLFWPKDITYQKNDGNKTEPRTDVITGLSTCDICGYDAIKEKNTPCLNCGVELSNKAITDEMLADKNSYIIQKQLEFFMPDTLGTAIDFLNPKVSVKGYPKNTNWRPMVFESQIYEFQKMILEIDAATDTLAKQPN